MVFLNSKHSVLGATGRILVVAVASTFAIAVMAWLASAAVANPFAPQEPQSPNAESAATAYWFGLAAAIVLIVAVNAALVAALMKFKSRRGDDTEPPAAAQTTRRDSVLPVAVFGLLAAAAIVVGVATSNSARTIDMSGTNDLVAANNTYAQLGTDALPAYVDADEQPVGDLDAPGATNQGVDLLAVSPVRIQAVGQRWIWRFEYPGNDPQGSPRFSYGELVVPTGTPVVLDVTSIDVAHTWWIPSLGGQVQAIPNTWSRTWFSVENEGTYAGASTTFSGSAFPTMRSTVRAVDPIEYRSWVEQLETDLLAAGDEVQKVQE